MLTDWNLAVVAAALSAIAASSSAWVAYSQAQIARKKLNFDLFEKRFAVYMSARELIAETLRNMAFPKASLQEFKRQTEIAECIFPPHVSDKMRQLQAVIGDFGVATAEVDTLPPNAHGRQDAIQRKHQTAIYLTSQFEELNKLFVAETRIS